MSNLAPDTITISREEYDKLIKDQAFLEALICCGVDNWGGYEEAQRIVNESDEDII